MPSDRGRSYAIRGSAKPPAEAGVHIGPLASRGSDPQHWADDHPVLNVLRERSAGRGAVRDKDNARVGLVVEGGGMRGIVSGAMLCAIEDLGFGACFDAVYGCSAGAVNAAYFVAGNCWRGLSVYHDDLSQGPFIDYRRLFRLRSFVDLDYVFKDVLARRPLDFQLIATSPMELHVAVTDIDRLLTEDVSIFEDGADLLETLYASAWMPIGSCQAASWRGRRALDGGVLAPHPLGMALSDHCTHVLSLSTRPIRPSGYRGYTAAKLLGYFYLEGFKSGLGSRHLSAIRDYWSERNLMHRKSLVPSNAPHVLDLAPVSSSAKIRFFERDQRRLLSAARDAYGLTYCALTGTSLGAYTSGKVRVVPRLAAVE